VLRRVCKDSTNLDARTPLRTRTTRSATTSVRLTVVPPARKKRRCTLPTTTPLSPAESDLSLAIGSKRTTGAESVAPTGAHGDLATQEHAAGRQLEGPGVTAQLTHQDTQVGVGQPGLGRGNFLGSHGGSLRSDPGSAPGPLLAGKPTHEP